jgi:prepilin-type N-terminal cleavage/methylation domain-containing protein
MNAVLIRKSGFTLVEMMIVVAIIGILASISIPGVMRARMTAQRDTCISNLRQIDSAKQQWAMELKAGNSDTAVESDLQPYLKHGSTMPTCPSGGLGATFAETYDITTVGEDPQCKVVPAAHILPH